MKQNRFKIFICATEQSGDNLGYNIISEILKIKKNISFEGVGGSRMSPLLDKQFFSLKDFSAMGVIEIIFSLKKFFNMINYLVSKILISDYDLIMTIDSPDFNFPLVKKLRKKNLNLKIIQIVAPTVWAWRPNRAKNFSKYYDEIFVLFDFEKPYFERYNLKTTFIGHPVYHIKKIQIDSQKDITIAFLPGSRDSELEALLPYFNLAYEYILNNKLKYQIFIPTLPHLKEKIKKYVNKWKVNIVVLDDIDEIEYYYSLSSKALVCSGTASLEIAKRNIPQLVIYKLNFFTELIIKKFVKVKYANIINIIENDMIIPEITNSSLNKNTFINGFKNLINNEKDNIIQIKNINKSIKKIESNQSPYLLAAKKILTYIN